MTSLRVLSVWFALRAFVSILSDMVRFSDPHSHRQHTRAPRYSTTVAPNEAAQAKQLIMSQPDALNAKKKVNHPHAFPPLSFAALVWMSRGALLTCAHVHTSSSSWSSFLAPLACAQPVVRATVVAQILSDDGRDGWDVEGTGILLLIRNNSRKG
jgi:hypothetical protein